MDNCSICSLLMPLRYDVKTTTSNHSGKTVYEIFTDINGTELDYLTNICYNCLEQCNEFDRFMTKAQKIKENFLIIINSKKVKLEVEDCDYSGFDNNSDLSDHYEETAEKLDVKIETIEEKEKEEEKLEHPVRKSSKSKKKSQIPELTLCPEPNCGRMFSDARKYKSHIKFHVKERNFICTQCGKDFKTKDCLSSHIKYVHTDIKAICDGCGKTFSRKHAVRKHYEKVHLNLKADVVCQICGKMVSSVSILRKHMFTHASPESKSFQCEICPMKFFTKKSLTRHAKSHAALREYSCDICGKTFNHSYNVNAHKKAVHGFGADQLRKEPPKFACQLCGRVFDRKKNLEKHCASTHEAVSFSGDLNNFFE